MKKKTARRFLSRNKWKIAKHTTKIIELSPSTLKRISKCKKVLNEDKI